jgi:hypothetical protein
MTNAVLTEIDRQKRVEEAATWTANENKMAERLTQGFELLAAQGRTDALAVELTPVESLLKQRFVEWCAEKNVRSCPARPSTVATFLMDTALDHEQSLDALNAIGKLHCKFNLPNPCATTLVRTVLETKMQDEKPPQSWSKHERQVFVTLPAEARIAANRIDTTRNRELRRCQNETADLRKKLLNVEKQEQIIKSIERPVEQDHPASP